MVELEGAADAERAADKAKAVLEATRRVLGAVRRATGKRGTRHVRCPPRQRDDEGRFWARAPRASGRRRTCSLDAFEKLLQGDAQPAGDRIERGQAHVAPAAFDVGQIGPRHPEQGGAGVLRQAPLLA